ncbi:MAG TPA: YfhO family protein, partial [Candidatus Sulfotelmatobacter sp.]|nr:YfhO family protein [Candidatus Sulfotelmatobacter sp.]
PRNYPVEIMGKLAELVGFNVINLLDLSAYLLAILVTAWLAYRGRIGRKYFIAIVLMLVVADLFANGASIPVGIADHVFTDLPPNFKLLAKDKNSFRFDYSYRLGAENRFTYGETYDVAMQETKDNFADNWHILYGLQDFSGYESVQPQAWRELMFRKFTGDKFIGQLDFLSRANVRYIAAVEKWHKPGLKLLRHKYKYGLDVYLYENLNYYPRAYLLGDRRARVLMDKYSPLEVIVTATASRPDKLFLADSYYPGWKAFVDGHEVTIEKSMVLFRAVKIPAGTHTVRFVYDPLSFKIGAGISLLTLVGLLAGLYLERRKWNVEHRT